MMILRRYRPNDAGALARVYREAVRVTGRAEYSEEQAAVWASFAEDEEFGRRIGRGVTLIAEEEGEIIGFGQLDPPDHIALLMTAPQHGRKGVATAIFRELEQEAVRAGQAEMRVEASIIARPLFSRLGFTVCEEETSEFKGMKFTRYRMLKRLLGNG